MEEGTVLDGAPTLGDGSAGEVHRTALAAKASALVAAGPSPSVLRTSSGAPQNEHPSCLTRWPSLRLRHRAKIKRGH